MSRLRPLRSALRGDFYGLPRYCALIFGAMGAVKLASIFVVPVCCDFLNWVNTASIAYSSMAKGHVPSIAQLGPYTGLALVLALFFAVWALLPIGLQGADFVFLMKLPILLFDLATTLLLYRLVTGITGSKRKGGEASLLWYLNPYNLFLMNSWSSPGSFDIIPASILLLGIALSGSRRWLSSGVSVAAAALIRLSPFLIWPFMQLHALQEGRPSSRRFLLGFAAPVAIVMLSQFAALGSLNGLMTAIREVPLKHSWLLTYYGFEIIAGLALAPFLLLVQLCLAARFWRKSDSVLNLPLAGLLVLFVTTYHQPYHFIWIMSILTAYCIMHRDSLALFIALNIFAFLSAEGYDTTNSILFIFQPLFTGAFYALKAAFLVRLNLQNLGWRSA